VRHKVGQPISGFCLCQTLVCARDDAAKLYTPERSKKACPQKASSIYLAPPVEPEHKGPAHFLDQDVSLFFLQSYQRFVH
jgi:hypothetical protein